MSTPGHNEPHGLCRGTQPIEEGFVTLAAEEALLFLRMDPLLPRLVWPLAWQGPLGQNAVVGSMTLLPAMRGNIATSSMSSPPFTLPLYPHHALVRNYREIYFFRKYNRIGTPANPKCCLNLFSRYRL